LFLFDGVLFTGDSILMDHGKLTPANPKHSVDIEENHRSIAALGDTLREHPVTVVCTGHMSCTKPEETRALLEALIASVK
jgi:glyoxylase-like metal-dependent hydrolase (beta-lactamase superfamily II)